jgi:hypothetical protein
VPAIVIQMLGLKGDLVALSYQILRGLLKKAYPFKLNQKVTTVQDSKYATNTFSSCYSG